jgi:hypothetical protein
VKMALHHLAELRHFRTAAGNGRCNAREEIRAFSGISPGLRGTGILDPAARLVRAPAAGRSRPRGQAMGTLWTLWKH